MVWSLRRTAEDLLAGLFEQLIAMGAVSNPQVKPSSDAWNHDASYALCGQWAELLLQQFAEDGSPYPFPSTRDEAVRAAIRQAILAAGHDHFVIDDTRPEELIDAEIIARIRRSRFVVVDFSRQSHRAYYDAGYG
jgi:hypothetical protein